MIGFTLAHHDELVAPQARDQAVGLNMLLQSLSDFLQDPITESMAQHVIDRLETVQIQAQQRQRRRDLARKAIAQELLKLKAIGQTGQ